MDNDFGDQASAESFANFSEAELSSCLNQLFEAKLFNGETQMLEFVIGKARESWDQRLVNSALTVTNIATVGNEPQASETTEEIFQKSRLAFLKARKEYRASNPNPKQPNWRTIP